MSSYEQPTVQYFDCGDMKIIIHGADDVIRNRALQKNDDVSIIDVLLTDNACRHIEVLQVVVDDNIEKAAQQTKDILVTASQQADDVNNRTGVQQATKDANAPIITNQHANNVTMVSDGHTAATVTGDSLAASLSTNKQYVPLSIASTTNNEYGTVKRSSKVLVPEDTISNESHQYTQTIDVHNQPVEDNAHHRQTCNLRQVPDHDYAETPGQDLLDTCDSRPSDQRAQISDISTNATTLSIDNAYDAVTDHDDGHYAFVDNDSVIQSGYSGVAQNDEPVNAAGTTPSDDAQCLNALEKALLDGRLNKSLCRKHRGCLELIAVVIAVSIIVFLAAAVFAQSPNQATSRNGRQETSKRVRSNRSQLEQARGRIINAGLVYNFTANYICSGVDALSLLDDTLLWHCEGGMVIHIYDVSAPTSWSLIANIHISDPDLRDVEWTSAGNIIYNPKKSTSLKIMTVPTGVIISKQEMTSIVYLISASLPDDVIYVSTAEGVFASIDGGLIWKLIYHTIRKDNLPCLAFKVTLDGTEGLWVVEYYKQNPGSKLNTLIRVYKLGANGIADLASAFLKMYTFNDLLDVSQCFAIYDDFQNIISPDNFGQINVWSTDSYPNSSWTTWRKLIPLRESAKKRSRSIVHTALAIDNRRRLLYMGYSDIGVLATYRLTYSNET